MKRAEVYRTRERIPERGHKPGYYVIVSRDFIASNVDVSTVVCAPVYGAVLGLQTEVVLDVGDGVAKRSAARCDFLTLMFKSKLTHFAGTLSRDKIRELDRALATALDLT